MAMRWALALLVLAAGVVPTASAQENDVIHCRKPSFRIPFQIDASEQARTKEIQLYVSDDKNQGWRLYKTATPEQKNFAFEASRDGLYLFLVRTISRDGRAYPPSVENERPGLKVLVDSQAPQVALRALAPRQDQLGFEWEIREEHADLATLLVEYRGADGGDWRRLNVEEQPSGQRYFAPTGRGPFEVRLRVRDRAENQGLASVQLGSGSPASSTANEPVRRDDNFTRPPRGNPGESQRQPRIVNSLEVTLNYSVEEVGPSGVSVVELYLTKDGRSWQKHGEDEDKQSPMLAKLPGEGVYGLTLVVKSGVGMGDRPPQPGDVPQIWIEIDLTKPVIAITAVDASKGSDGNLLTILWKAEDKNLLPQPISLHYAETADGPWSPIATDLENAQRYVWRVPPATPYKFFVRVDATDRGGNVGRAETPKQVVVDLSMPKGRLLGVDAPSRP